MSVSSAWSAGNEGVLDAWYDEAAQFDENALTGLVVSAGFQGVELERLPVWGDGVLAVTAARGDG